MRVITHILAALAGLGIGLALATSTRTIASQPPAPSVPQESAPAPTAPATRVNTSPDVSGEAEAPTAPYRVIALDVDGSAGELEWCRALQAKVGGQLEYRVGKGPSYGRVDLLTDEWTIETDWLAKWQSGLGQALHYAHETGKAPVLALALKNKRGVFRGDREECDYVASLCAKHGIAVWVLHVEP